MISDTELRNRFACATCGSRRLTAAQPGIDTRFLTAACHDCSPKIDPEALRRPRREGLVRRAVFETCNHVTPGRDLEADSPPCSAPIGHGSEHTARYDPKPHKPRLVREDPPFLPGGPGRFTSLFGEDK